MEETLSDKLRRFGISSFSHTFENFITRTSETKECKKVMQALSNGESKLKFVLLWGTTGCGKTHLIEATIINWAEHGVRSYYQTFSDITRRLKEQLKKGGDFYDEQFKAYRDRPILIVDDFGMGNTESRFEISDLEDIVDWRYRKRYYPENLITLLATNKDLKELPDRIVSRFYDFEFGAVLYMGNKDYRKRK